MNAIPNIIKMGYAPQFASVVGHSDLAAARNRLFTLAYVSKYDKMLFIDTDMSWEDGTIERLLFHDVDVVGAAYRFKQEEERFTVKTLPKDSIFVDPKTNEVSPFGILEVGGIATGLLVISKACITEIISSMPDDWYKDTEVEGGKCYNVFEFSVIDHERYGEDIHFCNLWRDLGGKVWTDPFLIVHHHGDATYSGQLVDHLRLHNKMDAGFDKILTEAQKALPLLQLNGASA